MQRDSGASAYEFFAGGGLARVGLSGAFDTVFANDVCPLKAEAYRLAHGPAGFVLADVWDLAPADLPGRAALAWASFPCQDLSLAGPRAGMAGARSGAFYGFWRLMEALAAEGRAPPVIALENVVGLLTAGAGADFVALCAALAGGGYRFGALVLDAAHFAPQSRPRLFVIAVRAAPPASLLGAGPSAPLHPAGLAAAVGRLPAALAQRWVWWAPQPPPRRNHDLIDVLEDPPVGACWNTAAKTERLLALMAPRQRARVEALRAAGGRRAGTLFRRVRIEAGVRAQRAEARFDGLAGCLRTPAGGSSRQTLILIEDGQVRTRLLSPRECARLMGLPDSHPLPASQTAALQLLGDGVCAPAAAWLSAHLLAPLAKAARAPAACA